MTDQPGTSISNSTLQPDAPQDPRLVAFTDCALIRVNNAMALVINRQNGNQKIIAPHVVEGLMTCTTFRTIEEHAVHLENTRPELQGKKAMAVTVLTDLASGYAASGRGCLCTTGATHATTAPTYQSFCHHL